MPHICTILVTPNNHSPSPELTRKYCIMPTYVLNGIVYCLYLCIYVTFSLYLPLSYSIPYLSLSLLLVLLLVLALALIFNFFVWVALYSQIMLLLLTLQYTTLHNIILLIHIISIVADKNTENDVSLIALR